MKSPKFENIKKEINIVFNGGGWLDLTNQIFIGTEQNLVSYVNVNRIVVINQDTFLYNQKFWYNK